MRKLSSVRGIAPCLNISLMASRYGLDDGTVVREHIRQILVSSGLQGDSTLSDLYRLTQKNLVCCTTNLTLRKTVFLSAEATPNYDESWMRSSCPCAYRFSSRRWNSRGAFTWDGALTQSVPSYFDEEKTLFFCFENADGESKSALGASTWRPSSKPPST